MKGKVKTIVAFLCTLMMLVPTCVFGTDSDSAGSKGKAPSGSETETTTTYEYVEFGSYPQTEIVSQASDSGVDGKNWATESDYIVDSSLYNKLKSQTGWDSNGDVTVDGNKYRRIKKSDATGTKTKDSESTETETSNLPSESDTVSMYYSWSDDSTYHYFKYEPIKWRILKKSEGDYFLLSEIILDDQQYNPVLNSHFTWENCTIRSWLNGYGSTTNLYGKDCTSKNFIDAAFTAEEKSRIKTSTIANKENIEEDSDSTSETASDKTEVELQDGTSTNDKIFFLSVDEASSTDYGFSTGSNKNSTVRQAKSSTYAKAMGTKSNDSQNCYWWLRTPGSHFGLVALIRDSGSVYTGGQHASSKSRGVRPAMHVNLEDEGGGSTDPVTEEHKLTAYPAKAATCTTAGNTAYWYCTDCKKYFSDAEGKNEIAKDSWVIPATGHTAESTWSKDSDYHWHKCENCTVIIDKADHTWNSGVVTTPATSTTDGVKTYICTVCNATKTEKIAATGGDSGGSGGSSGGGSGGSSGDGTIVQPTDEQAAADAKAVVDVINLINTSDICLDSEECIVIAREAYNVLSDEAKAKVTNLSKLIKAEEALKAYKEKYVPEAAAPDVETAGYNSVDLSWEPVEKAEKYDIYRFDGSIKTSAGAGELLLQEGYQLIASVDADSSVTPGYEDNNLVTDNEYRYVIVAVNYDNKNRKIEVKSAEITATPVLNQVASLKLTKGKKYAKVKWSAVSGATGYKVYRSAKKTSGFKCVKTIKGKSTSFVNKKLKSGKTYYYKVRAFRTADGITSYGAYSVVKGVKVR